MATSSLLIQPIWQVSQDVIVVTTFEDDPAARSIVYVNPAFTALTGYDAAEAVGKPASLCEGAETDHALLHAAELPVHAGAPHECVVVKYRRDGTDYCYKQGLAPLKGPDGKPAFLIESGRMVPAPPPHIDTGKQPPHFGLTLPMPLMEFRDGKLPKHLTSHPETDALQALWQQKRKGDRLPARADFTLGSVRRWASHLFIAAVLPDGRFQFTMFGSDLTDVYGCDLSGALLDELTPADVWKVVIQHYREVVQTKQPLFCPISVSNGRWYTEVSRLLLPLSNDGVTVSFILGADYSRAAR
jgi:PAS domain S-box-containing protein